MERIGRKEVNSIMVGNKFVEENGRRENEDYGMKASKCGVNIEGF